MRSSRYMNKTARRARRRELARSAAPRAWAPRRRAPAAPGALGLQRHHELLPTCPISTVGPATLPEFYMPYTHAAEPPPGRARGATPRTGRGGWGCWTSLPGVGGSTSGTTTSSTSLDVALLRRADPPGRDRPSARPDARAGSSGGPTRDDYFPVVYGSTRDMAGAKVFNARLSQFMPLDVRRHATADQPGGARPGRPVGAHGGPACRRRGAPVPHGVEDMTESWLWELNNQIQHRIPDPVDYIEMRRKTFGSDLTMSLSRLATGDAIPPELFRTRTDARAGELGRGLRLLAPTTSSPTRRRSSSRASSTTACWWSRSSSTWTRTQAVSVVNDLMTSRMQQFEHMRRHRAAGARRRLRPGREAPREALDAYVVELQHWMAGILDWHTAVGPLQGGGAASTYREGAAAVRWPHRSGHVRCCRRSLSNVRTPSLGLHAALICLIIGGGK